MRFFRTFSLLFLLMTGGAWAQCAGGLIVNCPTAVSPQPTDVLQLWQLGQTPHMRKVPLSSVLSESLAGVDLSQSDATASGLTNTLSVWAQGIPLTLEQMNVTPRCVANGTTDCLPAFNAAIALLSYSTGGLTSPSGGHIQLGVNSGCYYVSGSVNMQGHSGLDIEGVAPFASCITTNGGNYPIFTTAGTEAAITNNIAVRNMTLVCGGHTNTAANGVQWAYVNGGRIDGNTFFGCNSAISLTGMFASWVQNNNITGQGSQQNTTCLYMGFPTDVADMYGDNSIIASRNMCQFTSGDSARLVDANGSVFDHNQWIGGAADGVHACDQPATTYPSGQPAICEFMFFDQDQVDTTGSYGWRFLLGSGGSIGPGILILQPWAGNTHTAAIDIENAANVQVISAEIETTDVGFNLINVSQSRIDGHVYAYNARNNGSQSVLLSGTSPGSQHNDVHVEATTSYPIAPSYNGIVETGSYSGNRLDAGFADCSPTLGLAFGGATTGISYASATNICRFEVHGTEVSLQAFFDLTSKGTATGAATLTGLPITAGPANNSGYGSINPCQAGDGSGNHTFASLTAPVMANVNPASATANLNMQGAADIASVTNANFTNTSALGCQLHYQKQ